MPASASKVRRYRSFFATIAYLKGRKPQDIPFKHKLRSMPRRLADEGASNTGVLPVPAPPMQIESSPLLPREADVIDGVVGVIHSLSRATRRQGAL
jgi:hypothetical protein